MMNGGVGACLLEVFFVVHRRGDDLARVGDRALQLDRFEPDRLGAFGGRRDTGAQRGKMRDPRIVARERIAMGGQGVERGSDIGDLVAAHEAKTIIVETAEAHGAMVASLPAKRGGWRAERAGWGFWRKRLFIRAPPYPPPLRGGGMKERYGAPPWTRS